MYWYWRDKCIPGLDRWWMCLHMFQGHMDFDRGADTESHGFMDPQGFGETITMSSGHISGLNITFRIGSSIGASRTRSRSNFKYINIFRGTYITALVSIACNPWKLVNSPTVFLPVMGGYMVFLTPTGIERYLNLVRRRRSCQFASAF